MIRRLTPDERRLWSRVARTVRAAPGKSAETEEVSPGAMAGPEMGLPAPANPQTPRPRVQSPPQDLSGLRKVRRGQSEIDARLDLHGHTQESAQRELVAFILREHSAGSRCLLVITGKGRLGTGVLRSRVHDWIADPSLRRLIAGYARAHPRHGGEGAVYLFLKAKRTPA